MILTSKIRRMGIFSRLIVLVIVSTSLGSCSKNLRYYTAGMQNEFKWSDRELATIQFYLSQDIILYKSLESEETEISKGKIRVTDGGRVEEVVIEKGTPGVFVHSPKTNRLAISFEDDDSKFLMFGPNKKAKGRFVLLAKDWERNYGKISYGDEVYETSTSSAYAALMVDIEKAKNIRYSSRTAEGKRVE